jgi:recombination protein RecA
LSIDDVLSRLGKKTRERVQRASEAEVVKQKTPSHGLNIALAGGLGYGRQTLVYGSKSAGKSSFCLEHVGIAQREGKVCAWIDAEASYDPTWAERLGVDNDQLILSHEKTIFDMTDMGVELLDAGVDLLVVDSISSLLPSSYFDKDGDELKKQEGTRQIGTESKDLAGAVKMLNYANKNTQLILISQIRNKITTYGASHQPTGGHAVQFFSSTVIKLMSSPTEAKQIKGTVKVGNKELEEMVGRPVNWTVEYNKIGPPAQYGEYDFYYNGDYVGIDRYGEIVNQAVKHDIITKAGAWYKLYGQQFQGKHALVKHLREDAVMMEKLEGEL